VIFFAPELVSSNELSLNYCFGRIAIGSSGVPLVALIEFEFCYVAVYIYRFDYFILCCLRYWRDHHALNVIDR